MEAIHFDNQPGHNSSELQHGLHYCSVKFTCQYQLHKNQLNLKETKINHVKPMVKNSIIYAKHQCVNSEHQNPVL